MQGENSMCNLVGCMIFISGIYIAAQLARFYIDSNRKITADAEYIFDKRAVKRFDQLIIASLVFFLVAVVFFIFISRHTRAWISVLTGVFMAIIGFMLLKNNNLMKNR